MKKVLILFGKKDWQKPAFKEMTGGYTLCYEYLYKLAAEHDIKLYRASYKWYDAKQGLFLYTWTFENEKWIRVHNIKPDLIYDKTSFKPETTFFKSAIINTIPIVNDIEFSGLIDNKLFVSLLFPQYIKKYPKAISLASLDDILSTIKTKKIVLKPSTASGGKGVHIIDKTDINTLNISFPVLIQEFIDSSHGIDKITSSTHDLRLVFIEDNLIYSYIRIPAKNSLLANLSQGGTMKIIPNEQLPETLNPLISTVQKTLSTFKNKMYTIDIMFDENQKPWIIELNSMPGLFFTEEQHKERKYMYTTIIKLFKKILR